MGIAVRIAKKMPGKKNIPLTNGKKSYKLGM
jgi:hypothetical protein